MMKNNQSGQSTIEFIFTFVFGVSVIFMVFNSALTYCTGYLVHYATFMASRVYLTSDTFTGGPAQPEASIIGTEVDAEKAFARYRLDIFKVSSDKFKINPMPSSGIDNASGYLLVGGRTKFEMPIDALGKITGAAEVELVSESFLGHEPTRAQCGARTCYAITGGTNCSNDMDITLYDNGC